VGLAWAPFVFLPHLFTDLTVGISLGVNGFGGSRGHFCSAAHGRESPATEHTAEESSSHGAIVLGEIGVGQWMKGNSEILYADFV